MDLTAVQQRQYALATAAAAVVLLVCGFFIGNEGGADVDAAKAEGAKAGTAAGTKQGKKQGYDAGYKKGYRTSYKAAYEKAKNGD